MVPVLVSSFIGILTAATTWGGLNTRIAAVEASEVKNEPVRQKVAVNTSIIETLGSTVKETKEKLDKFVEKYDRNREEDQRLFREMLAAVKK